MKCRILFVLLWLSLAVLAEPVIDTTNPNVRLGWKPSPSANVSGYYLCWGYQSGQNTNRLDVGNVTNTAVGGLVYGPTYYFVVVAYSSFGDEAPPSNEVYWSIPKAKIRTTRGLKVEP
jgi:hypothetical protein